jgi:xylan 1,4-beta-xylosidase
MQSIRMILCLASAILTACSAGASLIARGDGTQEDRRFKTYANPIDLPYRYQSSSRAYREAADPTVVTFNGRYWLFASHSKGYWHSTDLQHWAFVEPAGYPVDKFAPTVVAMNGKLYLAVSERAKKIWVTEDPMAGIWSEAADLSQGYDDPCLFLDDDGRVYMYEGLSGKDVLRVVELDPTTFQPIGKVSIPESRDKESRGWEVVGDHNEKYSAPSFVEGSWVTKYQGTYYLQYAAPGTEFKTYADGVLVGDRPMGPFTYQRYSPFSVKPTGFISGAGHGSTFQAFDRRWWHAATMTISRRHPFERRLGLFPAVFTAPGDLVADTYLGDYPHYFDGDRSLTGWMLLSRHKAVTASSSLDNFAPEQAVDEDIRTWWSAKTGGADEWFQVDLGAPKRIEAVQINFADQDSKGRGISADVYKYILEISLDGQAWTTAIDAARLGRDAPHDYRVLPKPQRARFIRIRNVHSPDDSKFSLYDLRVFGRGFGPLPESVISASAQRDRTDQRKATIAWRPASNAEFYVVRLGTRPDQLTQAYQVYDGNTAVTVASLNVNVAYYFAVDAINESGIKKGRVIGTID